MTYMEWRAKETMNLLPLDLIILDFSGKFQGYKMDAFH